MRATIDLPDDLFHRAKAAASLRGLTLKQLLVQYVELGLAASTSVETYGHTEPIPVRIPAAGRKISVFTNSDVFDLLDQGGGWMAGLLDLSWVPEGRLENRPQGLQQRIRVDVGDHAHAFPTQRAQHCA